MKTPCKAQLCVVWPEKNFLHLNAATSNFVFFSCIVAFRGWWWWWGGVLKQQSFALLQHQLNIVVLVSLFSPNQHWNEWRARFNPWCWWTLRSVMLGSWTQVSVNTGRRAAASLELTLQEPNKNNTFLLKYYIFFVWFFAICCLFWGLYSQINQSLLRFQIISIQQGELVVEQRPAPVGDAHLNAAVTEAHAKRHPAQLDAANQIRTEFIDVMWTRTDVSFYQPTSRRRVSELIPKRDYKAKLTQHTGKNYGFLLKPLYASHYK